VEVAVPSRSGRDQLQVSCAGAAGWMSPSPQGRVGTVTAPSLQEGIKLSPSPQGRVGTGLALRQKTVSLSSPSPQGRVGTTLTLWIWCRLGNRRPLKVGSGRVFIARREPHGNWLAVPSRSGRNQLRSIGDWIGMKLAVPSRSGRNLLSGAGCM